jgi:hypothetical protein
MSLSAKWTAVTLFALTALGAGSLAAGCTVTSGDPDNSEGGTGNNPPTEASTPADTSTGDGGGPNKCPGNTQQKIVLTSAACQAAMEAECCAEITACFGATIDTTDAAAPQADCNIFAECIADCTKKPDGTPETDQQAIAKCQADLCDSSSPTNVQTAYDAMIKCQTDKQATNDACQ